MIREHIKKKEEKMFKSFTPKQASEIENIYNRGFSPGESFWEQQLAVFQYNLDDPKSFDSLEEAVSYAEMINNIDEEYMFHRPIND